MVVDEMWVEFNLVQVDSSGGGAQASCSYVPTPSFISDNGVQLFYNGQSVYTLSEAEAYHCLFFQSENQQQFARRAAAQNVYARPTISTASINGPAEQKNAKHPTALYYLDLRVLLKIMKNCGPLGAYAPNKWSISVGLVNANLVGQTTLTASTTVVDMGFTTGNAMRLLLNGHREDAQNVMRISQALAADGIKLAFSQSNHFRYSVASTTTGLVPYAITSLEGEATGIQFFNRKTDGLTAISTAGQSVNKLDFTLLQSPDQQLAVGTQSNPTRIYGQYLPYETLRFLAQGAAYNGGPVWTDNNSTVAAGTTTEQVQKHISMVAMPLCEAASDGQMFGTYSGSVRLKNDFVITLNMGTAIGGGSANNQTVDILVFIRRIMVITHLGIVMMNEG